jgi:hypothetical protein
MSYYNTTTEVGDTLRELSSKALTQSEEVYKFFVERSEVCKAYAGPTLVHASFSRYPITSIRRALSDLTSDGLLVKTPHKCIGAYGRREHLWRLA